MLQIAVFILKTTPILPKITSCGKFQVWLRKNRYSITKTAVEEAWEDSAWKTIDILNNNQMDFKSKNLSNGDIFNLICNDVKTTLVFAFFAILWIVLIKRIIQNLDIKDRKK